MDIEVRHLGRIDYDEAWALQKQIASARAEGSGPDTLLLLEHDAIYTAGKRTRTEDRPTDGSRVIDVDRGGRITWHGPGQIVGYPLVKLADPVDVVQYVRRLEQAMIAVCDQFLPQEPELQVGRVEGRSGVWLPATGNRPERKIAAIGIRVQRGVTMHGFELNCNADLTEFDRIVPCGISDAGVTSLSGELGRDVPVDEVMPATEKAVLAALDGSLPLTDRNISRDAVVSINPAHQRVRQ